MYTNGVDRGSFLFALVRPSSLWRKNLHEWLQVPQRKQYHGQTIVHTFSLFFFSIKQTRRTIIHKLIIMRTRIHDTLTSVNSLRFCVHLQRGRCWSSHMTCPRAVLPIDQLPSHRACVSHHHSEWPTRIKNLTGYRSGRGCEQVGHIVSAVVFSYEYVYKIRNIYIYTFYVHLYSLKLWRNAVRKSQCV